MTREEAISIMNVIVHMLEPQYDTDHIEDAVDMAIKALRQQPCEDTISRQAIIVGSYLLEDERYHTCGRCKHGNTPYCSYPCSECVHGVDNRKDYWEFAESEVCKNDEDGRK